MSRILAYALMLFVCLAVIACRGYGQALRIVGGNQLVNISTGTAGGQPTSVVNTACTLRYQRQNVVTNITVGATCPGQRFTLKVLAVSPTAGIAAPEVTLTDGMPAANFITNIPTGNPKNSTSTLRYTASATYDQGNSTELGNDVYTVVYTLVAP